MLFVERFQRKFYKIILKNYFKKKKVKNATSLRVGWRKYCCSIPKMIVALIYSNPSDSNSNFF